MLAMPPFPTRVAKLFGRIHGVTTMVQRQKHMLGKLVLVFLKYVGETGPINEVQLVTLRNNTYIKRVFLDISLNFQKKCAKLLIGSKTRLISLKNLSASCLFARLVWSTYSLVTTSMQVMFIATIRILYTWKCFHRSCLMSFYKSILSYP